MLPANAVGSFAGSSSQKPHVDNFFSSSQLQDIGWHPSIAKPGTKVSFALSKWAEVGARQDCCKPWACRLAVFKLKKKAVGKSVFRWLGIKTGPCKTLGAQTKQPKHFWVLHLSANSFEWFAQLPVPSLCPSACSPQLSLPRALLLDETCTCASSAPCLLCAHLQGSPIQKHSWQGWAIQLQKTILQTCPQLTPSRAQYGLLAAALLKANAWRWAQLSYSSFNWRSQHGGIWLSMSTGD